MRKIAPEFVAPGAPITYTVRVENIGSMRTSSLTVRDVLPDGAALLNTDGLLRPGQAPFVEWQAAGLDPGQVVEFRLVVSATTTVVNADYSTILQEGSVWRGDPVVTLASSRISTGTVDSSAGGIVTSVSGDLDLHFPPNTATQPLTVTMVEVQSPLNESGFAGIAFGIEAADAGGNSVKHFANPLTLTVHYADADWQNVGIEDESQLNLYVYTDGSWRPVLPCAGCSHDRVNNTFTALLDHLSLFALRRVPDTSYLPILRR